MRHQSTNAGALFDVKPVDETGHLADEKISGVSAKIDLRKKRTREDALREIEASFNRIADPRAELARVGALAGNQDLLARPRYHPVTVFVSPAEHRERHHKNIVREIESTSRHRPDFSARLALPKSSPNVVAALAVVPVSDAGTYQFLSPDRALSAPFVRRRGFIDPPRRDTKLLAGIFCMAFAAAAVAYGLFIKEKVIQESARAVSSLESARAHLSGLDFDSAEKDFLAAYRNFSDASARFKTLGVDVGAVIETLPGTDRIAAGRRLVEAGSLVADAGSAVSQAIGALASTRHFVDPTTGRSSMSDELVTPTAAALAKARDNVNRAADLLADVNPDLLPDQYRSTFAGVKDRLPEFKTLAATAADAARFFEDVIGSGATRRYLLLFQNFSEIRPSGGFPGSYGIATFTEGRLTDLKVDDIYNPDGQLKDLIIPPQPLQHITPTWAMRDAGWFIDFPESAQKFLWFFQRETGLTADGVIAVSPRVLTDLLALTGPIKLPAYNLTLTPENFLAEVQADVEYGDNNTKLNQPKKILADVLPLLLAKLSALDGSQWLVAVNDLLAGLQRKDVTMYFSSPALQKFVLDRGIGGAVSQVSGDYLNVNFANVKGAKADAVTDNALAVATTVADGAISHKVTITRTHNGGTSPYGFYNRRNPSWVRVLVPKGSRLISISGNVNPAYRPLVDYAAGGFTSDPDISVLESSVIRDSKTGVATGMEAGKTSLGFWMITEPGQTTAVTFEYAVPVALARSDYDFLIQKQPGIDFKSFSFSITPSKGIEIESTEPSLRRSGDSYTLTGSLERDLGLNIRFK